MRAPQHRVQTQAVALYGASHEPRVRARHPGLLLITDAAINIAPDLAAKRDITQNTIDLARAMGIEPPRAALVCAVETVTPALPSTCEAASLCKMADRGQIGGGLLDGPLALNNAVLPDVARPKGILSALAPLASCPVAVL